MSIIKHLDRCIGLFDHVQLAEHFKAQGEFVAIENGLDSEVIEPLLESLPHLRNAVHRSLIPGHKKGGSVSRHDIDKHTPLYKEFYSAAEWIFFLSNTVGKELLECPLTDPHTYALYYYDQAGDHIGYHYDTSYYRGERFTVLIGLLNRSSCLLEYELHTKDLGRIREKGSIALNPGTIVIFNGDRLRHRVTPSREGEQRIALTFEYVTDPYMTGYQRFISHFKDSLAYFGFRAVFGSNRRNSQ